ncbi:hypothetical protein D3C79_766850 [compost metagenome]
MLEDADFQLAFPGRGQAITLYQLVGDRAADHASGNQADGVAGDAQFMGVCYSQLFDKQRCPRQGSAHPTGEGY